jgi:signal transduction histidine kinase
MTLELQRTLRQLSQRQALAAVGEFAAELAHEVRNPLTSVRLDLQRVGERLPEASPMRESLHRAVATIDRLNRTVTGALRVARSGTVVLKPLSLGAALEPAIEAAMPEFSSRNVALRRETADLDATPLQGDADALTQLFTNVLFNAAQAIEHGGTVAISASQNDGFVTVAIADNGPGMTAEQLARLAEPFHTSKRGGTGLGLTIARRIATAHGGRIDFESELGSGTVVRVRLPREGRLVRV